jgi:hypothetical protein
MKKVIFLPLTVRKMVLIYYGKVYIKFWSVDKKKHHQNQILCQPTPPLLNLLELVFVL